MKIIHTKRGKEHRFDLDLADGKASDRTTLLAQASDKESARMAALVELADLVEQLQNA